MLVGSEGTGILSREGVVVPIVRPLALSWSRSVEGDREEPA